MSAEIAVMTAKEEFELEVRKAKTFAISPLVPEHLRNGGEQVAIANCFIAMTMAKQMGENPLVVMQNIYIVKGKAGWSSQYMIAKANGSGLFRGGLRFRTEGKGDTLAVTCYATFADAKDDEEQPSITVSMEMAKAEGWVSNSKYRSMPEQMLRYRSAAFFVRTYCPQVMLGYQTVEEIDDVISSEVKTPKLSIATVTEQPNEVITDSGEVITQAKQIEITVPPVVQPTVPPVANSATTQPDKPDKLDELIAEAERLGEWSNFLESIGLGGEGGEVTVRATRTGERSKMCIKLNNYLQPYRQEQQ